MSKTVLLVGGSGVISSAITSEAIKQGYKVTMINRGRRKTHPEAEVIVSDKNDTENIKKHLDGRKFDAICDFLCYNEKEIEQSFNLYKNYTNQYIFISSCAVYDKTIKGEKNEDSPKVTKVWPYSVNKWKCECLLNKIAEDSSTNITIVRPCITYGDTRIPYGITPPYGYHWTIIARILNNKPIITWNNGKNCSNMMRVEDFATAFVPLIGNPSSFNQAFNICGDDASSFEEVLDIISKYLNKDIIKVDITPEFYAKELPKKAGEILGGRAIDGVYSNSKIKKLASDWKQKIPLAKGIECTLKAYQTENFQKGIDWNYDAECDRIIAKWCKSKNSNTSTYNLKFVDYLKNATLKDRYTYFAEKHKSNKLIHCLNRIIKRL